MNLLARNLIGNPFIKQCINQHTILNNIGDCKKDFDERDRLFCPIPTLDWNKKSFCLLLILLGLSYFFLCDLLIYNLRIWKVLKRIIWKSKKWSKILCQGFQGRSEVIEHRTFCANCITQRTSTTISAIFTIITKRFLWGGLARAIHTTLTMNAVFTVLTWRHQAMNEMPKER